MNVYKYIRKFAEVAEVDVTEGDVARIASVLRTANFRGELSKKEMSLVKPLVAIRLGRIAGAAPKVVVEAKGNTASPQKDKIVEGEKDSSTFERINELVKQGKCARCGKPTEKVALANYEDVYYCPECRTTLWI